MIRTQISLTEQQMERLRRVASRRGTSIAAVVREAVDSALDEDVDEREMLWERSLEVIGSFEDPHPPDHSVAVEHDRHLAEIFYDWKPEAE